MDEGDEENGSSSLHLQKRQRTEDSKMRSAMLDFDVLNCPICFEPLTIPILQCDNGHLACSSCCPKLSNKCPSCASPIGHIRCRAMETVLESLFVPCRNAKLGCTKNVCFGKESAHKKECNYSLFSCPAQGCNFTGSYIDLHEHYTVPAHPGGLGTGFICGDQLDVMMNINDKICIKREYCKRLLFAVQCFREPYGVYVSVSCIAPSSPEVGHFSYRLSYNVGVGHTITYESPRVTKVLEVNFATPQENSMLIPHSLLRGEVLELKLCIKKVIAKKKMLKVILKD